MFHARDADRLIAPEAVRHLCMVLSARDRRLSRRVHLAAGRPDWLKAAPDEPVEEAAARRLHTALWREAAPELAEDISLEAGRRCGDEILAEQVPKAARMILRLIPGPVSARLAMETIEAHSPLFVGSGKLRYRMGRVIAIEIAANPFAIPRDRGPACVWQMAVLLRLAQSLLRPAADIAETSCVGRTAPTCRFEVSWLPGLDLQASGRLRSR